MIYDIDYIPEGHENAVPRARLRQQMEFHNDRDMRDALHGLSIETGVPIINFSDGRGYFTPKDTQECLRARRQELRRARSILDSIKVMDAWLKARGYGADPDQLTLGGME